MPNNTTEPTTTSQEEVAEQLALHEALKRTRLEEAARNPRLSLGRWAIWIVAIGLVLFLRDALVENLWMIIILLLVQIETSCGSVHKRIDAILELDILDHSTRLDRINKKQNKSEQAMPRKPSD